MVDVSWIDQIVNLEEFLEALSRATHESMVTGYQAGGIEVGYSPDFIDPEIIRLIQSRTINLSQNTAQRIRGNLKQAILDGVTQKEGVDDIARRVGKEFDRLKTYEAERIARTEMLTAFNLSREAAWASNPYAKYKVWLAHFDRRTADDSKRLAGQVQEIGDAFVDWKEGTKVLQPPLRPNDRCLFSCQTPIYTSKGWKPIGKIIRGDLVLTHEGRFRSVTKTFQNPTKDDIYKVKFTWSSSDYSMKWSESLSVTREHPFLTTRGWLAAKNLRIGDELVTLAAECKECGRPVPSFYSKFCCKSCASRNSAKNQWMSDNHRKNISEKLSRFWNKWNKDNPERRKEIVKNSHKVLAEKAKRGEHPLQSEYKFIYCSVAEVVILKPSIKKMTYNIEVEEDNSYIAKGIVNHNCTSIPLHTLPEDVVTWHGEKYISSMMYQGDRNNL